VEKGGKAERRRGSSRGAAANKSLLIELGGLPKGDPGSQDGGESARKRGKREPTSSGKEKKLRETMGKLG